MWSPRLVLAQCGCGIHWGFPVVVWRWRCFLLSIWHVKLVLCDRSSLFIGSVNLVCIHTYSSMLVQYRNRLILQFSPCRFFVWGPWITISTNFWTKDYLPVILENVIYPINFQNAWKNWDRFILYRLLPWMFYSTSI